jgi:hypothetical protein
MESASGRACKVTTKSGWAIERASSVNVLKCQLLAQRVTSVISAVWPDVRSRSDSVGNCAMSRRQKGASSGLCALSFRYSGRLFLELAGRK